MSTEQRNTLLERLRRLSAPEPVRMPVRGKGKESAFHLMLMFRRRGGTEPIDYARAHGSRKRNNKRGNGRKARR